jgi:hypothetical protein
LEQNLFLIASHVPFQIICTFSQQYFVTFGLVVFESLTLKVQVAASQGQVKVMKTKE